MKKHKRTKLTITMTVTVQQSINQPDRVSFQIGPWTHHGVTKRQAENLIAKYMRARVFVPYPY